MSLIEVEKLGFSYGRRLSSGTGASFALRNIDLSIESGQRFGIVGESGSGKSTLIRILSGMLMPTEGTVRFDGHTLDTWLPRRAREFRLRTQMIFQNPASSLDPRMRVGRSLREAVRALERRQPAVDEVTSWIKDVGLPPEILESYPHQLSGGQLQRVAIARHLSVRPDVLYADEPTSALDVSVQGQVLNVLAALRERYGLTLVLVSHDLAVIGRVCDQIAVMHEGRILEVGSAREILSEPENEYTRNLVHAARAVSL